MVPSQVAEGSPYYEAFKRAGVEVLFCYQEHDEIVLGNLGKFKDKNLKSIEVCFSLVAPWVYGFLCVLSCVHVFEATDVSRARCIYLG